LESLARETDRLTSPRLRALRSPLLGVDQGQRAEAADIAVGDIWRVGPLDGLHRNPPRLVQIAGEEQRLRQARENAHAQDIRAHASGRDRATSVLDRRAHVTTLDLHRSRDLHDRLGVGERRRARQAAKPDKGPPRWQRELSKGSARTTFLIGMLLTLPGASYLGGLDEIDKLHYSTTVTVLLVIGFNLIMLWLLEVPLVSFAIAPQWTPRAIERAKTWVSRHAHVFAVRGLTALGVLLSIKGIIGLVS
jgi:hypothetical protein